MNEDFWLIVPIAVVWAILGVAYALVPWGDMIGYAWVWGFGSLLFLGLSGLLLWCKPVSKTTPGDPGRSHSA